MSLRYIKKVLRYIKRNLFNEEFHAKLNYKKYLTLPIDEKMVLLESTHGASINGNVFYLLKELCSSKDYENFKKVLVVKKDNIESVLEKINYYGLEETELVSIGTKKYYQYIATAKYLINDTTFLPFFIKRDEQIYLNTWHGTPWKCLGKSVKSECNEIGNVQKNLFDSDYLLYPNEFTRDIFLRDYMLSNSKNNSKIILNGYPRNTVFFDKKRELIIREENELIDKQVICYLPTWRGLIADKTNDKAVADTLYYLNKIDKKLSNNQEFYVNLHPYFKGKIDFTRFKKIKEFPSKYETYDFLNIADALVTDYSSVFFDYAISGKHIINFMYDQEDYLEDRGLYFGLEELPFDKARSVNQLFKLINKGKKYNDENFIKKFCPYENKDASKQILGKMIYNKDYNNQVVEDVPNNGKENVLIYVGNLAKNGITSTIKTLLSNVDTKKYNFYLTFRSKSVRAYKDTLLGFSNDVYYIPMQGKMNLTFKEKIISVLYNKNRKNINKIIDVYRDNVDLEVKRLFGNIHFDSVIHYTGYDYKIVLLFSLMKANKAIYVHSNMVEEIKSKGNSNFPLLHYAYNTYDKVAVVSDGVVEPTREIKGGDDNFHITNNLIDYNRVKKMSGLPIKIDDNTEMNIEYDKFINIIDDSKSKKIINIGRFSPEKGHMRLIDAFDKTYEKHKDQYLIIIGGYGPTYEETIEYANTKKSKNRIVIIKSVSNPYSILKKCDLFVFSSYYEALGLAMIEALILNIPVISTNIHGPKEFLELGYGLLVDDSTDGLIKGINQYYKDGLKKYAKLTKSDAERYNENAIQQFYDLLK